MIDTGKTVKVLGKEYPVMLDNNAGFVVQLGEGNELRDATFSELWLKAGQYKDARFSLPFTTADNKNGTVTGFHASNGNLLIRWDNGRTEQTYGFTDAMPRLSDADAAEFTRLFEAHRAAWRKVRQFVETHKFPDGIKAAAEIERQKAAGLA